MAQGGGIAEARSPRQLFASFQDCAKRRDVAAFAELFADDGTLELHLSPAAAPLRFDGREAIREGAFEGWSTSPFTVEDLRATALTEEEGPLREPDVETLVAEYEVRGRVTATDEPFTALAMMVIQSRRGSIVAMREYLDPIALGGPQSGRASSPSPLSRGPREVLGLFHRAMASKCADDLADLYAEDGVHEFSFFTPNVAPRLEGREAVRAAYRKAWAENPLDIHELDDVFVIEARDPEVVVGQWHARATVRDAGRPVDITGLLVLRVRDGVIVHTRDFMDALGVAHALGRPPFTAPAGSAPR